MTAIALQINIKIDHLDAKTQRLDLDENPLDIKYNSLLDDHFDSSSTTITFTSTMASCDRAKWRRMSGESPASVR